jgi:hypothetical protein
VFDKARQSKRRRLARKVPRTRIGRLAESLAIVTADVMVRGAYGVAYAFTHVKERLNVAREGRSDETPGRGA